MKYLNIVFDGPPGPDGPRFVEVEDLNGESISFGEWLLQEDGYWHLQIPVDQHALARQLLKRDLSRLPERSQILFKRMYGEPLDERKRTPAVIEKIKARPINTVIDQMPDKKLDWAMQQVARTLEQENARSNKTTP